MIATIFGVGWRNLSRDRSALLLTFGLPVLLFSIFALVFGAMDSADLRPVPTVIVSHDDHPLTERLIEALSAQSGLQATRLDGGGPDADARAMERIRRGDARAGLVFPAGFGGQFMAVGVPTREIRLLTDRSHPVAAAMVGSALRAAAFDLMVPTVLTAGGPSTGPARLRTVDVPGTEGKRPSVSFFAAGIGVMFLLFSVSGRSSILLDERRSGVLQRIRAAGLGLGSWLLGRWLYLTSLGALQVAVMFVWASIAFGLRLWSPSTLGAFSLLTVATAAAAAGFGLLLSSICRTRAQLHAVSTVLVLVLSAVGGSMFPDFLMPEFLQRAGKWAFNTWALDGYRKIFWYERGPEDLGVELLVLLGCTVTFVGAAHALMRRREVRS